MRIASVEQAHTLLGWTSPARTWRILIYSAIVSLLNGYRSWKHLVPLLHVLLVACIDLLGVLEANAWLLSFMTGP